MSDIMEEIMIIKIWLSIYLLNITFLCVQASADSDFENNFKREYINIIYQIFSSKIKIFQNHYLMNASCWIFFSLSQ